MVNAPPPVCAACKRVASHEQTQCAGCGAPLPARSVPDFALGPTHPGIRIPDALPDIPRICGTAQLSIQRITRLRVSMDHALLDATCFPDSLVLTVSMQSEAEGLPLPAHLGIAVSAEGAPEGDEQWVDVESGRAITLRYAPVSSGTELCVRARYADARCERRITAR